MILTIFGLLMPLTAMNAVLAIIADGKQAIIVIDREGVEINYLFL
jgi:hypothetical protein